MKKLAVFASGSGTNARRLIEYAAANGAYTVALLVTNKASAGAVAMARDAGIPVLVLDKERFFNDDAFVPVFQEHGIEWIVLAGFLWKIPVQLISHYPHHIINIHPALLPRFGGKGMYGLHVHTAVMAAGETETGITIHYVDELYDHGAVIFQASCPVLPGDTPETLQQRVQALEHAHYPEVVERIVR